MDGNIDKVREALDEIQNIKWLIDEGPAHVKLTEAQDRLTKLKSALSAIDASADPYAMHVCGTCSSESGAECTRRNCDLNNAWEPKPATPTILSAEPAQDDGKPESPCCGCWLDDGKVHYACNYCERAKTDLYKTEAEINATDRAAEVKRRIEEAKE